MKVCFQSKCYYISVKLRQGLCFSFYCITFIHHNITDTGFEGENEAVIEKDELEEAQVEGLSNYGS